MLFGLIVMLEVALYAGTLILSASPHRSVTLLFWSAGMCFLVVAGVFSFTEIRSATGRFKRRDYFLTSMQALDCALGMHLRATAVVRGVWAFTSSEDGRPPEFFHDYVSSTLAAARARGIRTVRLIDLANLPVEAIVDHIDRCGDYLRDPDRYELRFCANVNYEMLIVDNSDAVMFFRMDEGEKRSWVRHADPIHVALVQDMYASLVAKSEQLIDVSTMPPDEIRQWLVATRAKLLGTSPDPRPWWMPAWRR